MPNQPTTKTQVIRFPSRQIEDDIVVVEEPVEIRVDGEPLAVTMRTPGQDLELAAGFCLTEGVIDHPDELEHVELCTLADYGNVVLVSLASSVSERWRNHQARSRRELYLSSSCGLCGTKTLDQIARRIPDFSSTFTISEAVLRQLPASLAASQLVFAQTGGLHAAAWVTPLGAVQILQEDIGRHNAVDKVIGGLLLSGQLPVGAGVMVVSSRASFELVQKVARAGMGVLAAVGAPSNLAITAAERFGVTLIGFLRSDRFTVYTHAERIQGAESTISADSK